MFDKRELGLSRRAGGGGIPPNWKLFWTFDSNQEHAFFSKRALFNEASDPQMLYISKIGPEEFNFMSFIYKRLENMFGGANNKDFIS